MSSLPTTVSESLRLVQIGINEARFEQVFLSDEIRLGIEGLRDRVKQGNKLSLEKIQKGKDDAVALIYSTWYEDTNPSDQDEGHQNDGSNEEETTPIDEPEYPEGYCEVWSEPNYQGESVVYPVDLHLDRWQYTSFATPQKLGSWKCTDLVKIDFLDAQIRSVSNSADLVANPNAIRDFTKGNYLPGTPSVPEYVALQVHHNQKPTESIGFNAFTSYGCEGTTTTLWTGHWGASKTCLEDEWNLARLLEYGDIASVRLRDGFLASFSEYGDKSGWTIGIVGETLPDGQGKCFNLVDLMGTTARSTTFSFATL